MSLLYALLSVVAVSLTSVISASPLLFKKKLSKNILLALLGISVGTLIGGVFLHFFPEMIEEGFSMKSSFFIIIGFITFFLIEKVVHFRHKHGLAHAHAHAYNLAPVNLIGDSIHNFIDGLVIGGAYLANTALGVAATISVIFHELPQEIADFGILIYSGYSKKKAIIFNLLSAATSIVGVIIAFILFTKIESFEQFLLPFAAGSFLYIAASNLIPELNRSNNLKDMFIQTITIILGITIMWLLLVLVPEAH